MKQQSKQERILEVFNPLIKQAIKERKLIVDLRDKMTYLPHYFKTLIESNSILAPSEVELEFYHLKEKESNGHEVTVMIVDDTIKNIKTELITEKLKKEMKTEETKIEEVVFIKDLSTSKNKVTTPRGLPKLNIGLRDVTISKQGMELLGQKDDFYFKLTILQIKGKLQPCIRVSNSDDSKFRKTKSGSKFICHRITLTDDIRDFYSIEKEKKFALEILPEKVRFNDFDFYILQLYTETK